MTGTIRWGAFFTLIFVTAVATGEASIRSGLHVTDAAFWAAIVTAELAAVYGFVTRTYHGQEIPMPGGSK
jgi:hypothetical protein